ncbi:hypothetical protein RA265_27785, partial [Pseudomonas syringae pv. tagetis]|uniref:hypothetical protein n=1 Tax=Pseudomonas syringae group genomosp. 7 TaxID=251699 RepID=UPI00376F539E
MGGGVDGVWGCGGCGWGWWLGGVGWSRLLCVGPFLCVPCSAFMLLLRVSNSSFTSEGSPERLKT